MVRKRRLSRKEQKARKRKKHAAQDDGEEQQQDEAVKAEKSARDGAACSTLADFNDDGVPTRGKNEGNAPEEKEDVSSSVEAILKDYVPTAVPTWDEVEKERRQHAKQKQPRGSSGGGGGEVSEGGQAAALGKWFPNAIAIKSPIHYSNDYDRCRKSDDDEPPAKASLVLFYQYVTPPWPESKVEQLLSYLKRVAARHVLGGRIRVAREGLNATVSSVDSGGGDSASSASAVLRKFALDLEHFDPVAFADTDFKYIDGLSPDRHFSQLKLFPVKELVFYGFDSTSKARPDDETAPIRSKGGVHLPPKEFHKKLVEPNTVVIDVRNHYEAAIGRFDGQEHLLHPKDDDGSQQPSSNNAAKGASGGDKDGSVDGNDESGSKKPPAAGASPPVARYIDPKMRKSTDFASWLEKESTQKELKNKQVLMYCTGGVRCERASAYLQKQYGDKLQFSGVYQLKGGIEAYLKEHSDTGGFWRGKNFVFDKREAVGVENPDGDGGVIRRKDKKATKKKNIETTCILCQTPWDRYVGKKKCDTCGVPVLMCDACMSSHHKRKGKNSNEEGGDSQNLLVRCPLCVEEGVTVRVADVEYTNNGVTSRAATAAAVATVGENDRAHKNETLTSCSVFKKEGTADIKKAAPSVLKWGGGHASQKKTKRRLRHRMCKFGADCRRQDCFFRHPGDGTNVPT